MLEPLQPTPFTGVNVVLQHFVTELRTILSNRFCGLYLTGSLALGDFDPHISDIDFIVLTDSILPPNLVQSLHDMHSRFDTGDSPWAGKIEAVYIAPEALRPNPISTLHYPQVEKQSALFVAPLESGWIFHLYTLREHAVTVAGLPLRPLIEAIDPDDMRRAAAPIAELWLDQAQNDPTWIPWLYEREHQAFVVLTLCRLLYTLDSGSVTSKPAAARWAHQALAPRSRWSTLIMQSLAEQHSSGQAPDSDIADTIAFVHYTVDRFQNWKNTLPPQ